MAVSLVQRLLYELKQSYPLNVIWIHNFTFDNYCLYLIIMDGYMQLFVPKWPIIWEWSVSNLNYVKDLQIIKIVVFGQKWHFSPKILFYFISFFG